MPLQRGKHVSEMGVADYVACNEEISQLVVGHVTKTRPVGILVLSSGAVYLGDDLAANPYGVLKARDERRFVDAAQDSVGADQPHE